MSTDPTAATGSTTVMATAEHPATAAAKVAASTWETLRERAADGIHRFEDWVRPGEEAVEAEAAKIFSVVIPVAAKRAETFLATNRVEFGQKIEIAVVALLASRGITLAAPIAALAESELEALFAVLIDDLNKLAPTPPAPVAST